MYIIDLQVTLQYGSILLYDIGGQLVQSISPRDPDYVNLLSPDTMQIVVPHYHLWMENEYYILLEEGVVWGPEPCILPSVAVEDPYFYRLFYGYLSSMFARWKCAVKLETVNDD